MAPMPAAAALGNRAGAAPRARTRSARPGAPVLPTERALRQQLRTRHLLLLDAIDRLGSLRRAANELAVTQPAATKLLAQLEALLGLPLFERHPQGVVATEYGRILVRHAQAALGELGAARDALEQAALGAQGQVALGAVVGSLPRLTSPALAALLAQRPRLAVSVTIETSATLVPRLVRGELDLLVGQVPAGTDPDALLFEPLTTEPIDAVVRAGHPLGARRRLALADVVDAPWVVPPPGTPLRERFDGAFRAAGLEPPRHCVETASTLLAATLALHGGRLALLSRDVAAHYAPGAQLTLLPLRLPTDPGPIGLVTRRRVRLSQAAGALADALREQARRLR
jgi:DNA-binding transcriptional LysR family regulator